MNTCTSQRPWLQKFAVEEPPLQKGDWAGLGRWFGRKFGPNLEGFYALKPKHVMGEVFPGVARQTIPQAAVHFAKHPLRATREAWKAMGHPGGMITGIGKPTGEGIGKLFPKILRTGTPTPAWYPSLSRLFFAGALGHDLQRAIKDDQGRGKRVGQMLGGAGGWLMGSRLNLLPMLATFIGGRAAGGGLGGLYDRATGPKSPQVLGGRGDAA